MMTKLQVLVLCRRTGLVKLGHVALDGTKVKADASRHKAMRYGRMCTAEARKKASAGVEGAPKRVAERERREAAHGGKLLQRACRRG